MKYGLMFVLFLSLVDFSFASSGSGETDIVPRVINFVIFAAIIYYLLAEKLKSFFAERTLSIQAELEKVQTILNDSKAKFEDAQNELEKAKLLAEQMVKDATNDIQKIEQKIEASMNEEMTNLQKHFDEKIVAETNKVKRDVVNEVVNHLLKDESLAISTDDISNIILKKVA